MHTYRLIGPFAALALITLAAPGAASAASATFSYSGLPLNTNSSGGGQQQAPFTGVSSISGQFTLDCTGLGNGDCAGLGFAEYGSRVTDYSFFLSDINAPISLTFANRVSVPSFGLGTDANRNLTFWNIVLNTTGTNCPANASICSMGIAGGAGQVLPPYDFANLLVGSQLSQANSQGSGSFTTAPVPLPIPVLMLISGIAAIVPLTRWSSSRQR
jgi:hypothetical protein